MCIRDSVEGVYPGAGGTGHIIAGCDDHRAESDNTESCATRRHRCSRMKGGGRNCCSRIGFGGESRGQCCNVSTNPQRITAPTRDQSVRVVREGNSLHLTRLERTKISQTRGIGDVVTRVEERTIAETSPFCLRVVPLLTLQEPITFP